MPGTGDKKEKKQRYKVNKLKYFILYLNRSISKPGRRITKQPQQVSRLESQDPFTTPTPLFGHLFSPYPALTIPTVLLHFAHVATLLCEGACVCVHIDTFISFYTFHI